MKSRRIEWLDFARGITMFLVVCAHSTDDLTNISNFMSLISDLLFVFIMPCFFAISGYLYKPIRNIHSFILMLYKKIISLGIPYIIFSVIYVSMQHFSSNVTHFHSYLDLLKIGTIPIDYLWFLYALFFMFMIVGMLDLFNVDYYIQFCIYIYLC